MMIIIDIDVDPEKNVEYQNNNNDNDHNSNNIIIQQIIITKQQPRLGMTTTTNEFDTSLNDIHPYPQHLL